MLNFWLKFACDKNHLLKDRSSDQNTTEHLSGPELLTFGMCNGQSESDKVGSSVKGEKMQYPESLEEKRKQGA